MQTDQTLEPTSTLSEQSDPLQAIIERYIARLDELKHQVHELNQSLVAIMDNDEMLQQAEQQSKDASKALKERKTSLTTSAEFRELRAKKVEMQDEVKEIEEALNTHLLNYYQQTGVKTVDLSDGAQRSFKITAKVSSKKEE
ncbi:MAG: hypothetical protein UX04_C0006G0060 [Microgenomates group bacterium GW2011_GWF2_45_18]|nr:MAG: hypothetical protein UW18_C0006G0060 [Microgenomates group bacterium GW2011_GWF1_44_10]KKU01525.1 MAG: hypothetical protein UX04_C0006G0060 [Microgenomates group bacterium GW2011_GWF2_45_18]OGJ41426.1 MAG: hypothetical protein A2378_00180 [Candidatus Pacebacteria bacterium RIFOXYB1_FULL_44_10]HAU99433.1 hypothetical protein [Candidatus Paceibacterota bacterium]HAX01561.1 hypothetical protein [Candidatus Paceibacterota bacterium]